MTPRRKRQTSFLEGLTAKDVAMLVVALSGAGAGVKNYVDGGARTQTADTRYASVTTMLAEQQRQLDSLKVVVAKRSFRRGAVIETLVVVPASRPGVVQRTAGYVGGVLRALNPFTRRNTT